MALRTSARPLLASTTLLVLAAVAAAAAFVVHLLVVADWGPVAATDTAVLDGSHDVAGDAPWLVVALKVISRLGMPPVYCAVALTLGAFLAWRRQLSGAFYVVATIGTGLQVAPLAKSVVRRDRPSLPDPVASAGGYSFPSGHAVSVTVVVLTLVVTALLVLGWELRRRSLLALALAVLVMCAARVVLGVHYLSDVVAGCLLGAGWVALLTALAVPALIRERRARPSPA